MNADLIILWQSQMTALHLSCRKGDVDVTRLLLANGADCLKQDNVSDDAVTVLNGVRIVYMA
jgi:ankyrin repeat protein